MNMKALDNLNTRSSIPAKKLQEPGPNAEQLAHILQTAMSVPDHGGLQPFRFLTIQGDARIRLAEVFKQAIQQRDPDAGEAYFQKQYDKPLRSPLIVVVVCQLSDHPKIPHIEQQLSAGCAAEHILLACHALDFGACWLTGDNCYDASVKEALGLDFNEQITGFIYIGSKDENNNVERADASAITSEWQEKQTLSTAI